MASPGYDHAETLKEKIVVLIDKLQPCLFIDRLVGKLSPDVCNEVREQPSDMKQAYTLISALLNGSFDWYEAFLLAIAGLYPDLFQSLTSKEPTEQERAWYLQPLQENLRESIKARPTVTNQTLKVDVNMEQHYVTPNLLRKVEEVRVVTEGTPGMTIVTNFHALEEEKLLGESPGGLVLLYGSAGVGKSILLHHLSWQWAHRQWGEKFSLVFTLSLHKLALFQNSVSLNSFLQEYAEVQTQGGLPDEGVAKWVENNSQRVLFLLDGLDELVEFRHLLVNVPSYPSVHGQALPMHWAVNLIRKNILSDSCVVLTSRSLHRSEQLKPTREVKISTLTEDGIKKYIQLNVEPTHRDRVWGLILKNPFLLSLCRVHFYCAAICKVLTQGQAESSQQQQKSAPLTTFTQITEHIVYHLATAATHGSAASLIPRNLRDCLPFLEKLAFRGLPSKGMFDEGDLNAVGFSDEDLKNAQQSGLLIVHQGSGLRAEFIHETVQHYFAVRSILSSSSEALQAYLKDFRQNNMSILLLYGLGLDRTLSQRLQLQMKPEQEAILEGNLSRRGGIELARLIYESQRTSLVDKFRGEFMKRGELVMCWKAATDIAALSFVMKGSPLLEQLLLRTAPLDEAAGESLKGIIRDAPNLQQVSVWRSTLQEETFISLTDIISNHLTIKQFKLTGTTFREQRFTEGEEEEEEEQEEEEKERPLLRENCMKSICRAVSSSPGLDELMVYMQRVDDAGMLHLSGVLGRLSQLRLEGVRMSPEGKRLLARGIATSSTLTKLWWSAADLWEGGAELVLSGIKENQSISHLSLERVAMDEEEAWAHLCHAIRHNPSFFQFRLYTKGLDDMSVSQLCGAVRSARSLRNLSVYILETLSDTAVQQFKGVKARLDELSVLAKGVTVSSES